MTWDPARLHQILRSHANRRGALLPILHDVQKEFDHIPAGAVRTIAEELNLSRAEVHGTVSFYHDFRNQPAEKPLVKICRAEACQARGVDQILGVFERDNRIVVEAVYCLGLCANGPSAMVGNQVFAALDRDRALRLIDRIAPS